MREAEAVVTCLQQAGGQELAGDMLVALDQTIFFPGGGGQSCDLGTIGGLAVTEVFEEDGEIWHRVACLRQAGLPALQVGQTVKLALDWPRRFDNMQRHCGEHILTGIFYREWRGINRGFHMGDDYMTIDIEMDQRLTWEMCMEAERMANDVIFENMPMIIRHFDSFAEADKQPMRKKLTIEEDITLVGIGSPDYDWGCAACCGTHPASTIDVSLIKVYKFEPNKGMYRIYFEAGRRAYGKYAKEFDALNTLCNQLSAGTDDVVEKFATFREKDKDVRGRLHFLSKEIIRREAAAIEAEAASSGAEAATGQPGAAGGSAAKANGADPLATATKSTKAAALARPTESTVAAPAAAVRRYSLLSLDDLVALAREVGPSISHIYFLVHEPTSTVILVSNGNIDCGKLVKENASIYNGKGGGNKTMARAIFPKSEYIDVFIDLIEKHLR